MSEMKIDKVKIDELHPYERNVRIHTKRNIEFIKKSLSEFGQTKPIVVRAGTNEILCGNGTYEAAKSLGWVEIDCHYVNVDDVHAKALMIADNRSSDLSQMDDKIVLDILQEFDPDMLDLSGYDKVELDKMLQFQEGNFFDDEPPKKKEKKEKKEVAVSADDQVSIILMGHPFVLSDPVEIVEIKKLVEKLDKQNVEVQCETTFALFNAIKEVIREAIEEAGCSDESMEIETDRL